MQMPKHGNQWSKYQEVLRGEMSKHAIRNHVKRQCIGFYDGAMKAHCTRAQSRCIELPGHDAEARSVALEWQQVRGESLLHSSKIHKDNMPTNCSSDDGTTKIT